MPGLLAKCANFVFAASGTWMLFGAILAIPWLQRQLLYLHWVTLTWGVHMNRPETLGFLRGQVAPFYISSKDDESLYAWLIAPIGVYAKHIEAFRSDSAPPGSAISTRQVFKRLTLDPEAQLIIYFHGNTATVAQGRRTQEYRVMASGSSDKLFVLSFDYRGFGKSTGKPSEAGLTLDAISVIKWAMEEAKIPADRIVLHAHSLGTAVATAAAHHFITLEPRVEFAGLLLSAAFFNGSLAFQDFGLTIGVMPLNGLKYFPAMQQWFTRRMKESWHTSEKLVELVRRSNRIRLTLMHAKSDGIMPYRHTEDLFEAVLQDLEPQRAERDQRVQHTDLDDGGYVETWRHGDKIITKEILNYGKHDPLMTWSPIALAILRTIEPADAPSSDNTHLIEADA